MTVINEAFALNKRFRGYFPVVIDVETAGFNPQTDALLEICAITLCMDEQGDLHPASTLHFHIEPFEGANIEKAALEFNGIHDPFSALRGAVTEEYALKEIYKQVRKEQKAADCSRAIIVAHNASFDHGFVMAANERCKLKRVPFHPFATFDTAALSGLAYGQTVLAKACKAAGMEFDNREAHSALYDTQQTAALFCGIINKWKALGGWPLAPQTNTTD
ncbi:ribonuclease T [Vibrio metschnikovii]|uniref:Ribonuclease T n=5 Tax=Unclassified Bacteria TaxID=49928 RepID=A0AAU6SZQ3_UNCXX|nr:MULTISPECIES: ribonuclease T [Vibrio]EKO3558880.1 ribonuclease T [Vibrio metschnikovii]EKO3569849.1 ribonuclease T [Vibrio metschnikovii]EKO3576747.1 ribonuclease T [Vibrio metschnikovii]EKO3579301.1 ribonuclease T [Vibrio metschnikovii]EKO3581971.1 ribonuclease T [Vibrio metschnikovii]